MNIRLQQGDITQVSVDAIVNAAISRLLGGGGVDGAIHRAAGPGLLAECRALGGCPTGAARLTGGHLLPARHVIHTVGTIYSGTDDDARLLASYYRQSLAIAAEARIAQIAFPAISCGVYGYPVEAATEIALHTTIDFLGSNDIPGEVTFICFDDTTHDAYGRALKNQS